MLQIKHLKIEVGFYCTVAFKGLKTLFRANAPKYFDYSNSSFSSIFDGFSLLTLFIFRFAATSWCHSQQTRLHRLACPPYGVLRQSVAKVP